MELRVAKLVGKRRENQRVNIIIPSIRLQSIYDCKYWDTFIKTGTLDVVEWGKFCRAHCDHTYELGP